MREGLKSTASVSLEAKAAIVGAMYALERLFSASASAGTGLTNYNAVLGASVKTLQQYQYVAKQSAHVTYEETENTFKRLSRMATEYLVGGAAPVGMQRIGEVTHTRMANLLKRAADERRPELILQVLQKYAALEKNAAYKDRALSSFVGDAMAAALNKQAFQPGALARAPAYSGGETKALDSARAGIDAIESKLEMALGHFTAAHGGKLIKDISPLIDNVLELANALATFAEKTKVFEAIGTVISGWTEIFKAATEVTKEITAATTGKPGEKKDEAQALLVAKWTALATFIANPGAAIGSALGQLGAAEHTGDKTTPSPARAQPGRHYAPGTEPGAKVGGANAANLSIVSGITPDMIKQVVKLATPPAPVTHISSKSQNFEVNQTLHFEHGTGDPKRVGDSTKKAVTDAYRQLSAQAQGS